MTISFAGLGSGMDYSSWIDALVEAKKASLTTIQNKITTTEAAKSALTELRSSFSSFNSTLTTFTDSNLISAFDIFGRKQVTSSDEGKTASATVSNDAIIQNFELTVLQLATPTVATGTQGVGQLAGTDTKLMELNNGVIKKGDISVYVNGAKKTFEIDENTTVGDFEDFLLARGDYEDTGVGVDHLTFENGLLSFICFENVSFGATSDTSNLLDFFGFTCDDSSTYSSSKILTSVSTSGKITSTANMDYHGFTAEQMKGEFKIGSQTFTIDDNTSISGLIYQINSNPDAGVTASYDAVSNSLRLTAKEPGATTINIEAVGDCKFTDAVGWTVDGNKLADGSQTLGQNSKFSINDKNFEAASNNVSSDVTGITGLTLSFNKLSNGEPAQFSITNDYTEVESAIDKFIEKYNSLISDIKELSSSKGTLAYDSSLRRMATELANVVMNKVPGLSDYISLSSVGISTGAANSDVTDVSMDLVFNKAKFEEAMAKNPNEVKKLFINEDVEDQSLSGVMTKLQNIVEGYQKPDGTRVPGYLDFEDGYFAIKSNSYSKQLETLNTSLTRKQSLIAQYKARLEKQFQNMDNYISQMQSYSGYLSSVLTSSGSNK